MTSASLVRRRIELGIGIRELGTRSGVLAGALKDAERRDTLEHFTVAQVRRLCRVLNLDPDELLGEPPAGADRSDIFSDLSDDALALLIKIHREECRTGYWSEIANSDPPDPVIAELLRAGAVTIKEGLVVLNPRIAAALTFFGASSPVAVTRTNRVARD